MVNSLQRILCLKDLLQQLFGLKIILTFLLNAYLVSQQTVIGNKCNLIMILLDIHLPQIKIYHLIITFKSSTETFF